MGHYADKGLFGQGAIASISRLGNASTTIWIVVVNQVLKDPSNSIESTQVRKGVTQCKSIGKH
jgi:hypothetical protein